MTMVEITPEQLKMLNKHRAYVTNLSNGLKRETRNRIDGEINELLIKGFRPSEIARMVECSASKVCTFRKKLIQSGIELKGAC